MVKIAVFLSGKGTNLQAIHKSILEGGITNASVACVISNKKEAGGLAYAAEYGIPARFVDPAEHMSREAYDSAVLEIMRNEGIGLICLAGFMRLLSPVLVDAYYGKMMNIHPSLLPAFSGANAQQQAIDYGAKITGATVHFVDNGMDTGPVILQEAVTVMENDTAESLAIRIRQTEHKVYPKAVNLFTNSRLRLDGRRVVII